MNERAAQCTIEETHTLFHYLRGDLVAPLVGMAAARKIVVSKCDLNKC